MDDEKIIFFEGLTIDYWYAVRVCMYVCIYFPVEMICMYVCVHRPNGFSEGPGGADYSDRQALAYHIYCPLSQPTALSKIPHRHTTLHCIALYCAISLT